MKDNKESNVRSKEEIQNARKVVRNLFLLPNLSPQQRVLLSGILNGLVWASGDKNETMERLLSGETIQEGITVDDLSERAKKFFRGEIQ
jgi:hypothetical protein